MTRRFDAVVVGAGPAGVGVALALAAVDGLRFTVLERGAVGQTFLRWPSRQTFLTPSFTGNGFGATDLNAVHPHTSPAFTLGVDYPTGPQYAEYLQRVAEHFELPIRERTEVFAVRTEPDGFELLSSRGRIRTRTLVWAGGEYQDPVAPTIDGHPLCDQSHRPEAWEPRDGELVVIGGYESGIEIACHHVEHGCRVTVVDGKSPWDAGYGPDPSTRLAPRTRMRLTRVSPAELLNLIGVDASGIERVGGRYVVALRDGTRVGSDSRPVAATGFGAGLGPVESLFELRTDGWPTLDDDDQSTVTPGLFLSGPSVRHGEAAFCFVYKFRQRFAHIARVIGESLGRDCSGLEEWREVGMLLDDLSCCDVECAC